MAGFEYRYGARIPQKVELDSSSAAISVGDAITLTGYNNGCGGIVDGDGDAVLGIAMENKTPGSSDADESVLVDVSTQSVYEVSPNSGTLVLTAQNNTCDVGSNAKTIDHDGSSTDDIDILKINLTTNKAFVRIRRTAIPGVA